MHPECLRLVADGNRGPVEFLTDEETAALVSASDPRTWVGRRDRALLFVVRTGLRNSEITSCVDAMSNPVLALMYVANILALSFPESPTTLSNLSPN